MTRTRQWLTALGIALIALLLGAVSMMDTAPASRSVRPVSLALMEPPEKFDPGQSAALFVGVREFDGDVPLVQYAVDDAVDLAYAFSFGGRSHLVTAERVVLALSGEPRKKESQQRLQKLLAAGATKASATAEELQSLLQRQAKSVTKGGILIVSFATHGFVDDDGVHYLLGRTSNFDADTALSATQVLDVASTASRSLVLVDACRERVPAGSRAGDIGPNSGAPMITRMTPLSGQVVLYAAAPRGYAFETEGNGVFTQAVLEGLACKGPSSKVVNVEQLHRYVDKRVRDWVQRKRPGYRGGTQINMESRTHLMPLANCDCPTPPQPSETWRAKLSLPVSRSEVADLDGDCANEVIVQAGGALHVFDTNGAPVWSAGEAIREFSVGSARAGLREVLALSPQRFRVLGHDGTTLSSVRGDLRHVSLYRPNGHHMNRVVATSGDTVLLFKSKKTIPEWRRRLTHSIDALEIRDYDNDKRLDLVLHTAAGRVVLDAEGQTLDGAKLIELPRK